jgi:predicted TIM-barrel fold metal-dependent hydrolase
MVVDFHTHIFPEKIAKTTIEALASRAENKPYTNGMDTGLINALKDANADIAVTFPVLTKPTQFDSVTRFALQINEQYKNASPRIISLAGIHPACEDIKGKMKFLKDSGFLGVKIHPDYQNTFIDDDGYLEILKCAKDYDLIVITHSGIDDGYRGEPVKCPPEKVNKVIDKIGHSKFVLAHFGAHKQWDMVLELLAGKDVYFDTAYTLHEIDEKLFKKIVDKHGDDKILFATDSPWRDIKDDLQILRSYNLGKETEEKILYKNAFKLLNIQE